MNWKLISNKRTQPATGEYNDWKEQIASECFYQCVYCSIHEEQFGGIDHYHIDHYRPKSIKRFFKLINVISNLYYSCPICNRFKKNDWPGEPRNINSICYPDPCKTDYSTLFNLSYITYELNGKYASSVYLIERLYLNRPQLVYERRETYLHEKEVKLSSNISRLVQKCEDINVLKKFVELNDKIRQHLHKRKRIRPYTLEEIKKPKAKKKAKGPKQNMAKKANPVRSNKIKTKK